jgi:hypothetical protein
MWNSAQRHVIPYTAVSISTTGLTLLPSFSSFSLHSSTQFSRRFHSIFLTLSFHFHLSFFLSFYYYIKSFMNSILFSFFLSSLFLAFILSFFSLLLLHFLPRILPSFYFPSVPLTFIHSFVIEVDLRIFSNRLYTVQLNLLRISV